MTSENIDLIEIVITREIVRKNCYTQLKSVDIVHVSMNSFPALYSYLTGIESVTIPCKDGQKNIEHTECDHSTIDRFVFVEVGVGEDVIPVDWHW